MGWGDVQFSLTPIAKKYRKAARLDLELAKAGEI